MTRVAGQFRQGEVLVTSRASMSLTETDTTRRRDMIETCLNCKYFDPDDTALPVCLIHRKFISDDWGCDKFESYEEKHGTESKA